mgnify:CR=1 FL=1
MAHAQTTRIQEFIGDPVSDSPAVGRDQLAVTLEQEQ